MKRRTFIKKSLGASVAAGTILSFGGFENIRAYRNKAADNFDLVAIKGGEPDVMFDKGIESLGGMKSFVSPNQTVVIKPNIGWDVIPEKAANTNPVLIKRIIEHCLNAGAKEVYVFDHTCDNWNRCYSTSGMEKVVGEAGGKLVPGNSESYYQQISIPKGKRLKKSKVHELILESDVFINVPVLKNHSSTEVTISMKNLMGVVWDRGYWHRNDLHQCIADFVTARKPDLNIVDAYKVMKRNGPRGVSKSDVLTMKSQIISRDIVAADAAAVKFYGKEPDSIGHVRIAHDMKIGNKNLNELSINRITI